MHDNAAAIFYCAIEKSCNALSYFVSTKKSRLIQAAFSIFKQLEQGVQLSRRKKEGITDFERFADTTAVGGT